MKNHGEVVSMFSMKMGGNHEHAVSVSTNINILHLYDTVICQCFSLLKIGILKQMLKLLPNSDLVPPSDSFSLYSSLIYDQQVFHRLLKKNLFVCDSYLLKPCAF